MSHKSAEESFRQLLNFYGGFKKTLLDIGGDGSGSYVDIANDVGVIYNTLNVGGGHYDVKDREYDWPIESDSFDIVASSSTFEHIEFFWLTFKEMVRVCRPGGIIYINAPSTGYSHWERDCWRFRVDGMTALAKWGGVKLISASENHEDIEWNDCVGIFQKL